MTQPANIRVNTSAPFPAKVKGSGPLAISKQNGIWTITFQIANLGNLPFGIDPTQAVVLIYNKTAGVFQQTSLATLLSGGFLTTTVTHAMSPYAPLPTDIYLLVDTTGGAVEIDLSLAVIRSGLALTIKDAKGNAAANNITIKPQGAPGNEFVDNYTNAAPLVLQANWDGVKLLPIIGGYLISP